MRFSTAKEVFDKMPEAFNPDAAGALDAVIQFCLTGKEGGDWHVVIKDGKCVVNQGKHPSPSVTLSMEDTTWVSIVNQEISGLKAFMTGKLKVQGDLMLAQRIGELFPV